MKPQKIFYPFSIFYGIAVRIRNFLYNSGIFSSRSFKIPVICTGNLSTGGTGKTPQVEYLMGLLSSNFKTAVLSRGYKRESSGFLIARKGMTTDTLGDEAYGYFLKFPQSIVAVGENRKSAIERILKSFPETDCIVMDDGMQHRSVKPGLLIMLTGYHHLFTRDHLLPAGHLREPRSGYKRADVIIVTKCPPGISESRKKELINEINPLKHQKVFFSFLRYSAPEPFHQQPELPSSDMMKKEYSALAFSGIAHPALFNHYVTERFAHAELISFSDHHQYTREDIQSIVNKFNNIASAKKIILTTGKDFVKLRHHVSIRELPAYYLPVATEFSDGDKQIFDDLILNYARANQ